jgi:hypothetical protein
MFSLVGSFTSLCIWISITIIYIKKLNNYVGKDITMKTKSINKLQYTCDPLHLNCFNNINNKLLRENNKEYNYENNKENNYENNNENNEEKSEAIIVNPYPYYNPHAYPVPFIPVNPINPYFYRDDVDNDVEIRYMNTNVLYSSLEIDSDRGNSVNLRDINNDLYQYQSSPIIVTDIANVVPHSSPFIYEFDDKVKMNHNISYQITTVLNNSFSISNNLLKSSNYIQNRDSLIDKYNKLNKHINNSKILKRKLRNNQQVSNKIANWKIDINNFKFITHPGILSLSLSTNLTIYLFIYQSI